MRRLFIAALAFLTASCSPEQDRGPVVLAAASLQEALTAAAAQWEAEGNFSPTISFAGSATVARQLAEGAPADIVITADRRWIDWLDERGALRGDVVALAGNSLVVIAPIDGGGPATLQALAANPAAGRLAIGEPDAVPAGQFAREALAAMGLWDDLSDRLVPGDSVRASLALVERGEVPLGIVYASDARASDAVRIVQEITPSVHAPIIYYGSMAATSDNTQAGGFLAFLQSPAGSAAFQANGFVDAASVMAP